MSNTRRNKPRSGADRGLSRRDFFALSVATTGPAAAPARMERRDLRGSAFA